MTRRPVAVLGATGVAGRQALVALANHPWFEVAAVASSARSAGRRLGDALATAGGVASGLADSLLDQPLQDGDAFDARGVDLVFSTVPADVARRLEQRCARTTPVVSTSAAFRREPDTPLLLAGVNPEHACLLEVQRRARGWEGWIAPTPNCTTVGLAVTLAPLLRAARVRGVVLTSLQAVSGAGGDGPRVSQLVQGNVLPFIEHEEDKVQRECVKILGSLRAQSIQPDGMNVSATCTRVAVDDGHTLCVSVGLEPRLRPEQAAGLWRAEAPFEGRGLPSAPECWIDIRSEQDRPQPALDREAGGGMTTVVGRVREEPALGGLKYVVVSHNAVLGAAGGAVLLAEDLLDRGLFAVS